MGGVDTSASGRRLGAADDIIRIDGRADSPDILGMMFAFSSPCRQILRHFEHCRPPSPLGSPNAT